MTVEEFESFADLDQSQDSDRTAILEEVQTQDSDRTAILETVQSQDSDRTAILEEVQSQDSDRTTIWEISKFNKRKYCEDFDDDAPRNCSQTKRSKPCDISQDYIFNEDQTFHDVSLFDSGTNQLNIIDDHTLEINPPVLENTENIDLNATQPSIVVEDMILPEVDQLQIPKRKRKQRKTHPVFDERRKMPILNDNSTSFDQYQKHHIEDLPRVNFDQMIYKHKFGVDVLFQTASRTNMSQNLIFLVKRNLKKIPQSVLDRKNTKKAITQETTPISKPTTRSNQAAKKCPGDKNNNTTLEFELPELEDEILKTARMSLFMVDDEIVIDEPVAKLKPRRNNTVVDEYDEE